MSVLRRAKRRVALLVPQSGCDAARPRNIALPRRRLPAARMDLPHDGPPLRGVGRRLNGPPPRRGTGDPADPGDPGDRTPATTSGRACTGYTRPVLRPLGGRLCFSSSPPMGDWRSWLARLHDTQEVTGSSPVSPTSPEPTLPRRGATRPGRSASSPNYPRHSPAAAHGRVAQLARALALHARGRGFESLPAHSSRLTNAGCRRAVRSRP